MAPMKTMKKPAAANHAMNSANRKGTGADENQTITEAALLQLQGAPDAKIDKWVKNLNSNNSMTMWKKYEKQRHMDGTQKEYEVATAGAGKRSKAHQLLRIFIKTGSTKSQEHRRLCASLTNSVEHSVEEEWLSQHEAVAKWGIQELRHRVIAGTIKVRQCPDDPRFGEFKAVKEKKKDSTVAVHSVGIESRGGSDKDALMKFMQSIKTTPNQKMQIEMEEDPIDADTPDAWSKKISPKGLKDKPLLSLTDQLEVNEQEDPEDVIEALETQSALRDNAGAAKCKGALATAKSSLETMLTQTESVAPESGPDAKKYKAIIKSLKQHQKVIDQLSKKKTSPKAGVVKKALKAAVKECKTAQKLMNS